MKQKGVLTESEIKDLPKVALARKYKCTPQYVGQVLRGKNGRKYSYTADCLRTDASKTLEILKP